MAYKYFIILILILGLSTLACGLTTLAASSPTTAPTQVASPAPTATQPVASLTIEQLKNAQYQLGARDDHAVVQLTDGIYKHGSDATTLDFAYVALTNFVAFGDLNGDGVNEAAAMFLENYGGTGNFGLLSVYADVNGLPKFLTSTFIDDRPQINNLSIENGEIFLDATIHGPNDGACCPQLPSTRHYALVHNNLRLMDLATSTSDGKQRTIKITSPANGTEVSGAVQVSGEFSIAPFENMLKFAIYDEAGNQISAGPLMVTASAPGAPGTFNSPFSLAKVPAGTTVYLEIQDQSAADSSLLLALDTVKLLVK